MLLWVHCLVSRLWVPDALVEKPDWMFYCFAKREMEKRVKRGGEEGAGDMMQAPMSGGKRPLTFEEMVMDTLIMAVSGVMLQIGKCCVSCACWRSTRICSRMCWSR
jgi:hypothetical protein